MFVHQFRFSFKDESTEEQRADGQGPLDELSGVDR